MTTFAIDRRNVAEIAKPRRFYDWRNNLCYGILVLALLILSACQSKTPPGSNVFSNTIQDAGCTFLVWKEGLRLMLWVDMTGSSGTHSSSSTDDPMFRQTGYAQAADGRRIEWQLATANGRTATFKIGDQPFDLAQGTLFLITTTQGSPQVQQLQYELAALPSAPSSCERVATDNAAVKHFTASH